MDRNPHAQGRAMTLDDDILLFAEEDDLTLPSGTSPQPCWKVLIVDDDRDVHEATELALRTVRILERPLHFLHAYSAAEALDILARKQDIAVILLDVVMESEDAGLKTISTIREKLNLRNVRIVLRTGQPGHAPEIDTISRYDINDYKTKSELTRNKLYITLTTAIRSYRQLVMLEHSRHGLEQIISASNQLIAEQGLQDFAEGVITQIAGLLDIEPEGLICASEDLQGINYRVIAAAGHYRGLIQHRIEEIDNPHIVVALNDCLHQRKTLVLPDSLVLYFHGHNGHAFAAYLDSTRPLPEIDRHLLEVFCANIALGAENVQLVARLRSQAFEDALVRLPNRLALINSIDQEIEQGMPPDHVLVLINIDQFSGINDTLGHLYGDQLLKSVAMRLRNHLPQECMVARVGGDIFGLFGPLAELRPEKLFTLFSMPLPIGNSSHSITVSIGAVDLMQGENNGSDYLKDAHLALKRAKTGGLSQSARYSPDIGVETRERATLLQNLRNAFELRQFFLTYQPQIDLTSGQPAGFEALLRWRASDGTLITPDRFIPVAESSGLIVPLGEWVLRSALEAQRQLLAASGRRLRMAVNVSLAQLSQPGFLAMLDKALADGSADPSLVEIEITESSAMLGLTPLVALLHEIKQRGVLLAIDDFGTGYSSLSYIDQLPVDRIKIDRAFVSPLDSPDRRSRIVDLVIPMGHSLGMKVLAEGVETGQQADILRSLGCDEGQGFLFARPQTLEDMLKWLED